MKDQYGREIDYMRISITDRCNLRCRYCMPEGVNCKIEHDEILRYEEFRKIAECGVRLGISHIKITGGEPLVRKGCPDLVRSLKEIPGIRTVTLTTNGLLLSRDLPDLLSAGLDGVNISLDSRDPEKFRRITGFDGEKKVEEAIRMAAESGIRTKVNVVTMPDTDPADLCRLAEEMPVDIRFIEMMPIGYGRKFRGSDNRKLLKKLMEAYPDLEPEEEGAEKLLAELSEGEAAKRGEDRVILADRDSRKNITIREDRTAGGDITAGGDRMVGGDITAGGDRTTGKDRTVRRHGQGPAVYFRGRHLRGSVGFISAIHGKFCASCNRVRLTSTGYLKTCLCYGDGADLRELLREGKDEELESAMREAIFRKPRAHCFETPEQITESHRMSQIGG